MILQSFDFAELNKRYSCELQIGGSDQWGNITGGIDLTRRMNGASVQGLTMPLVTKADGTKFGKTESGTIWLDASKRRPMRSINFGSVLLTPMFINSSNIYLPLGSGHRRNRAGGRRARGATEAQSILAREVTKLVHGDAGLEAAERITHACLAVTRRRCLSLTCAAELGWTPSSEVSREALPETLTQL